MKDRGPLRGVRVLEMGGFIAGPFAGQLLGDYGADVIKIEPPRIGDSMRAWGVSRDGHSLWWPAIARNKRSVTLDLRAPEAQEIVRQLVLEVDVVIENFRPGTVDTWGLDYERLSSINPRVIMAHVSGFGQTGPSADQPGFGSVAEAVGGIRFTTGSPDRPPSRSGISLGDSLASLFAVIGIAAALVERSVSGKGQEIDVAIYEAVMALMESTLADYELEGVMRTRSGSSLPGVAPSNAYRCSDGADVVIAANADGVFKRLVEAMGQPELASDEKFASHRARGTHADELDAVISQWTGSLTYDSLLGILRDHSVPAGPINSAAMLLDDAHVAARNMIVRLESKAGLTVPMNGIVPKFSRTPGAISWPGPELGEHTLEVLQERGTLSMEQIHDLQDRGIV